MRNARLYLLYGIVLSLAILVILLAVRMYQPSLLDLDVKWLVVAGIPLLVALIVGRFITKFNGFGISIEVAANEQVDNTPVLIHALPVTIAEKGPVDELDSWTWEQLNAPIVLTFASGGRQYSLYATTEYIRRLPGLLYLEIEDEAGRFMVLKKITEKDRAPDSSSLMDFLAVVREDQGAKMDNTYTKTFACGYDSVIDTLQKLRYSGKDFIAILNNPDDRVLIGVATECGIGRYLATNILRKIKADGGEGEHRPGQAQGEKNFVFPVVAKRN